MHVFRSAASAIVLGLAAQAAAGCDNGQPPKTVKDINNTLSAPEHVNTSTEPQGPQKSGSPAPASSK